MDSRLKLGLAAFALLLVASLGIYFLLNGGEGAKPQNSYGTPTELLRNSLGNPTEIHLKYTRGTPEIYRRYT